MRLCELVPPENAAQPDRRVHGIHIVDSGTTGHAAGRSDKSVVIVDDVFSIQRRRSTTIGHTAITAVLGDIPAEDPVIVDISGDDTTVSDTFAGISGYRPDAPETTAADATERTTRLEHMTFLARTDGNVSRFALSALGRYARRPKKLESARDLRLAMHRPLEFRVLDTDQTVLQSGLAITSIGVALTARILQESASNTAQKMLRPRRWLPEPLLKPARLAYNSLHALSTYWHARQFQSEILHGDPDSETFQDMLENWPNRPLTGIELIGSRRARFGRSQVNIDDTRQRLVLMGHETSPGKRLAKLVRSLGRPVTGRRNKQQTIDLADGPLFIRLSPNTKQALPFHVDGKTGGSKLLEPGHVLEIRLTDIAIPVLMQQTKARHRGRASATHGRRAGRRRQPKHSSRTQRQSGSHRRK